MSLGGPKMVVKELWGGLKLPENCRKSGKLPMTHDGRRHRFIGPIPACPEAVGREILLVAASGCPLHPWPARVAGGWSEVPPSVQSSTTRRWLNGSTCVPGLESFFLGFLELKSCFGARVSFGITSYVYIWSRVVFG